MPATLTTPDAAEAYELPPTASAAAAPTQIAHVLIATDGKPATDAAVAVGGALARRLGLAAELLAVCEPPPVRYGDAGAGFPAFEAVAQEELRRSVLAQRGRTSPPAGSPIPLRIERGHPASTIARVAREHERELVVLGLGAHGGLDRVLGRETALQVIRGSTAPVLAVAPDAAEPPRRAMVAVDFSASSLRAARAALDLLAGGGAGPGALFLVHVVPRLAGAPDETRALEEFHADDAYSMLERFRERLRPTAGVRVRSVLRAGDSAAPALLAFARENCVELIATGTHGRGLVQRAILGSVSTKLLRTTKCSMLVVR